MTLWHQAHAQQHIAVGTSQSARLGMAVQPMADAVLYLVLLALIGGPISAYASLAEVVRIF